MSECRPISHAPLPEDAALCKGIRDRMLIGLVLFTLVRSGEALAGDQVLIVNAATDPEFGGSRPAPTSTTAAPAALRVFTMPTAIGDPVFSTTDFRPRKHTVFDRDATDYSVAYAPMLHGASVWERMSEFKSNEGVRLLTLWESRGSSISLQASNRGDPSLQWSSRLMNHGSAKRGIFDRLFPVNFSGVGTSPRNPFRPASAAVTPKPANAPVAASQ
jgi:hypothetical protein